VTCSRSKPPSERPSIVEETQIDPIPHGAMENEMITAYVLVALLALGLLLLGSVLRVTVRAWCHPALRSVRSATRGPGLALIAPLADRLHKVNMQIVTMPAPYVQNYTQPAVLGPCRHGLSSIILCEPRRGCQDHEWRKAECSLLVAERRENSSNALHSSRMRTMPTLPWWSPFDRLSLDVV
jgi:hypothetical protein